MRHTALCTALATALASTGSPANAANDTLTIYSGDFDSVAQADAMPGSSGFALVERQLGFDLKAGDNAVQLGGLPRALDASSVMLRPQGAAIVRGQRFDFAVAGQDELLRRAIGQTITVEQAVGNDRQSLTGTLVAAGNGLTLRLPDGRIKMLASFSSFELPRLPDGVVNEPTMNWAIAADRAGRQDFRLDYSTAGLAWRAEYNAIVRGQGKECRMELQGAAMVANRSGADFNEVMLTLVAGEPNRASADAASDAEMAASAAAMPQMRLQKAASAPPAEASGEYQAYNLPSPGSLPQGSVQRLPLLDPVSNIACERRYDVRSEIGGWTPRQPIIDANFSADDGSEQPVIATLRFRNGKAAGLGLPLPAGRVRMFDGSDFLGEAGLGHTAANADVVLPIGKVFDLGAKRKREGFQLDRKGRTMTENVSITLRNAKPGAVSVRVAENLPRWSDWEIVSSTVPHEKTDARGVRFDVMVPADGEATVRYTVRYRWAADVTLPE